MEQWYIYSLNHSAFDIGKLITAQMLPNILFMILGGAVADRFNRKKLLLFTQTGMAVVTTVIAVLITVDVMSLNLFLAFNFIYGLMVALDIPARRSFVPALVPKADLANANALYAGTFQIALFLGPMVGSILTAKFGFLITFYFNAVSFAGIIIAVALMNIPKEAERVRVKNSLWRDIAGTGFILKKQKIILLFVLAGFLFSALGRIDYLIPPFVEGHLQDGAVTTGVLNAFIGLGLIVGAVVVARFDRYLNRHTSRYLVLASLAMGIMTLLFPFFQSLYSLNAVLLVRSMAVQIGATLILTSLQFVTDEKYLGRVMGIYSAGLAVAGLVSVPMTLLAEWQGVIASFVMIGAGALLLCVFLLVVTLKNRFKNRFDQGGEEVKGGF